MSGPGDVVPDAGGSASNASTHAVTIKLAPFYASSPGFWFAQVESQFRVKKITDQLTKFDHVVQSLSEEVALRVSKAVESQQYQTLKDVLMKAFDMTSEQRAAKLLHLPGLGDRLPSKLAAEIIAILPKDVEPCFIVRQIFIEQLPVSVQQNMAAHRGVTDLIELADFADGYVAAARNRMASCVVEEGSVIPPPPPFQPAMCSQNGEDHSSCAAVEGRRPPGNWGRPNPSQAARKLCWRHAKFGKRAFRCDDVNACDWRRSQGNGHAGRR